MSLDSELKTSEGGIVGTIFLHVEMSHLYTTKDRRSEEKVFKKGKMVVIFISSQSTSYSYRFNPMDYIIFVHFPL